MSYAAIQRPNEWWALGSQLPSPISGGSWLLLWEEQHRMQPRGETFQLSPTSTFIGEIAFPFELTWSASTPQPIRQSLELIEQTLGVTVKELARILCVSRPMIYHWRAGMEPLPENRARIEAVARLSADWSQLEEKPLGDRLHLKQAEGDTLMDLLSSEVLDVSAIRVAMMRLVGIERSSEKEIAARHALRRFIAEGEPDAKRLDVIQERQSAGKCSYVGDANHPGKLLEIRADGTRRTGRMVNRQFVPDEEE